LKTILSYGCWAKGNGLSKNWTGLVLGLRLMKKKENIFTKK
jgi:hypothetical protein